MILELLYLCENAIIELFIVIQGISYTLSLYGSLHIRCGK